MAFIAPPAERQRESQRQRLHRLVSALKTQRSSFEAHWRQIADFSAPRRARFTHSDRNKGDRRNQKIINNTVLRAKGVLSAGMMSSVTSPARPWFRLSVADKQLAESHAVRVWLDEVRDRMLSVIARSNTYNQFPLVYEDLATFGTAAVAVEEDDETTIRCTHFPIGEYWVATNGKQQVRTFVREFELTVEQLLDQFGRFDARGHLDDSNLSTAVVTAWQQGNLQHSVQVTHVITENADYDPGKLPARFKRYKECYYETGTGDRQDADAKLLREAGYDEFPVLVPRWLTTAGDVYGTDCPGMRALPDNLDLQFSEKMSAQAIEKMVKPPMIAPSGARTTRLSILPGDVSYVDEGADKQFRPAVDLSRMRLEPLLDRIEKVQDRINQAYYVDLFLMISMIDRGDVTATEIRAKQEEKLLVMGPVLERVNEDMLDPFIDRVFAIMLRRNELPPVPPELDGVALRVEYVSIMAQAQKSIGRSGVETFVSMVGAIAEKLPQVADKVDFDQVVDVYAEQTGIDTRIVVDDETVAEIRAARAQAAQAQQAAEMAEREASAAHQLAETKLTDSNMLETLLARVPAGV